MDEFTVVLRARDLVQRVKSDSIPVPVELYLQAVKCTLKIGDDLKGDEAGYSFPHKDGHYIVVNGKDSQQRQRFTILHEIAHIELGLPSDHAGSPSWSYAKRSQNEIFCDVFASELLLPYRLFKPFVDKATIGFAALDEIARTFDASVTATGSRFALASDVPCAFILSEGGRIKYASRSKSLREGKSWITPGTTLPSTSSSADVRKGKRIEDVREVAADVWFSDWRRGGVLLEEARHLGRFDQTITLLWFEDEELPNDGDVDNDNEDEEIGLKPLDGDLPWPGKRRRR